jgi:hypothetical protein
MDRIEDGRAHRIGMHRDQCHGDGRAVGFAVDVPALYSERPPHPLEIGNGDAGAEIVQIEVARGRLGVAGMEAPTLGQGVAGRVHDDGEGGIEKRIVVVGAELRLRSAGHSLIDEDQIAAWGVGRPSLLVGVDGQGAAARINDGIGQRASCCALLTTTTASLNRLLPRLSEVVIVPWDADKETGNLRAVQLLLGQTKLESTVRYLAIGVDDALGISEQVEL